MSTVITFKRISMGKVEMIIRLMCLTFSLITEQTFRPFSQGVKKLVQITNTITVQSKNLSLKY
jgi:hypothetical protein